MWIDPKLAYLSAGSSVPLSQLSLELSVSWQLHSTVAVAATDSIDIYKKNVKIYTEQNPVNKRRKLPKLCVFVTLKKNYTGSRLQPV